MSTVTIPTKITKGEELVIIPKKDYDKLVASRVVIEYQPTTREKKALVQARRNRLNGNFLTIDELKRKLGFTSR